MENFDESSKKCLKNLNDSIFSADINDSMQDGLFNPQQTTDTFGVYKKSIINDFEQLRQKTPV